MFKVGDKVKIIGKEFDSINEIGDKGTIVEIDLDEEEGGLQYRVHVGLKRNFANWHTKEELEIIK